MSQTWGRVRQALNAVLAVSMPVTTALTFGTGEGVGEAMRSEVGPPFLEPAGYAFIIWAFIYAGSIAYALYQALPSQADNDLFRDIGWWTASAFLGTSTWLVMARLGLIWMTFACIVWILASLAGAFYRIVRVGSRLGGAEQWLAVFPLSAFTGWVTAATFANLAAALKVAGFFANDLMELAWSLVMLVGAGLVTTGVTGLSRGNVGYAATAVWALTAIAAANQGRYPSIVLVAWLMAALVIVAFLYGRSADGARQVS